MQHSVKSIVIVLAMAAAIGRANAQPVGPSPPPRLDSATPTGVSYKDGTFSYSETDLSIGAGDLPIGLVLQRSYRSDLDGAFATSSGINTQGWSVNLVIRLSQAQRFNAYTVTPPPPNSSIPSGTWLYSIVRGISSTVFFNSTDYQSGQHTGNYVPSTLTGETLTFTGAEGSGYYTYTTDDGDEITLPQSQSTGSTWKGADGTILTFTYALGGLKSVFSNRGYALIFEIGNVAGGKAWTKACAVNLAVTYVTPTSNCPAGVPTVTYNWSSTAANYATWAGPLLLSVTDATGGTTTYGYSARGHLDCVKRPGQSTCSISNTYNTCYRDPALISDPEGMTLAEKVLSQTTATGENYTYSFPTSEQCPGTSPPSNFIYANTMTLASNTTEVKTNIFGVPVKITDPIGRYSSMEYDFYTNFDGQAVEDKISKLTKPEGDTIKYEYDSRGNLTKTTRTAKPGSGQADIVEIAAYPATCSNAKTCNKPTSVTDAKGNATSYTYDASHGGVLTETGPAALVNGAGTPIAAVKRYAYAQRYAWIKNSGGTYSQATSPVWLMVEMRTCRTTATISGACAGGAADEVVTSFDYGPNSGPNTLLLRGTMVTADGVSRRTCYGYDAQGNRISETKPRAGLTQCL